MLHITSLQANASQNHNEIISALSEWLNSKTQRVTNASKHVDKGERYTLTVGM